MNDNNTAENTTLSQSKQDSNPDTKKPGKKETLWDLFKFAIIAFLIVYPFRAIVARPYVVDGLSMDPTFKNGDYLIVDQISKRFTDFQRGDVVILRYPKDTTKFFIKRLIGFPGEEVIIKEGQLFIRTTDGETKSINEPYIEFEKKENFSQVLGDNEYFVMGDNRAGSSDSRIWGTLPKENITGEPLFRLLPLSNISLFPGRHRTANEQ